MTISPVLRGIIRAPHRLGGVAKSCSLFVATPSGPLTVSRAWQELLLIRRNATPHPSEAPAAGISQSSTCIWPFLRNLEKMIF
jgi:hypothetical protein